MIAAAPSIVGAVGEPISIALLSRLRSLIAGSLSPLSEYSFANLFLYRGRHAYRFHETPIAHVRGRTYDGETHAMPLEPLDAGAAVALLEACDCIGPVGEEGPALAARLGLSCGWNEDDSDYVYDAARLAALSAAKAKRAQARQFAAAARPVLARIDADSAPCAAAVLDGWFEDVGRNAADTDLGECREALDLRDQLGLDGRLVLSDGRPVAFLLAGPGADGSRIVHFAKGRRDLAGAYPWMFAAYAAEVGGGRLNFEQDLGKPGFAQAKRAFAPTARLRKYRLRRSS